jgi:hypothetical protein
VLVIRVFVIDNSKALEGMAPVKDTNSGLGGIALGSIVLVEVVYDESKDTAGDLPACSISNDDALPSQVVRFKLDPTRCSRYWITHVVSDDVSLKWLTCIALTETLRCGRASNVDSYLSGHGYNVSRAAGKTTARNASQRGVKTGCFKGTQREPH